MSTYEKVVKAATKPKHAPPKAKYIDPILAATFSHDGSLQDICKALSARLREPNVTVVFKSLIVLHTMIRNGSCENVLGYLASEAHSLRLKAVVSGSWSGYAPPANISFYAKYLDERIRAFRELRHDVIRDRAESSRLSSRVNGYDGDEGTSNRLRRLTVEKGLVREVAVLQKVCDSLVECKFFMDDIEDDVTLTAFRMVLKDLLALFTALNEGVINILEHYFEMSHVDATRALDIYKRFCRQTEKVVGYFTFAKNMHTTINVAIPNLKHAPVSLGKALQEYLDDPNFEQNRSEYKENKKVSDKASSRGSGPSTSATAASSERAAAVKAANAASKRVTIAEPEKPVRTNTSKTAPSSNKELVDFFTSIESEQTDMFNPAGQPNLQPQMTGFTGGANAFNPFGMGMGPAGLQPQITGVPFGGGVQPQMTGFQGQSPFVQPQQTGFPMQQQHHPMQMPFSGVVQPQPTGFNPFRQSMMPTGMGMSMGGSSPFGVSPFSPSTPNSAPPTGFQQPQQTGATTGASLFGAFGGGASNSPQTSGLVTSPFSAAPPSMPAQPAISSSAPASASGAPGGTSTPALQPQKTGSRNPFNPPPGETPPPPPPPTSTGPSLNDLAMNAFSGGQGQGHGAFGGQQQTPSSSALASQKTGMGASLFGQPTGMGSSLFGQPTGAPQAWPSSSASALGPQQTGMGASLFGQPTALGTGLSPASGLPPRPASAAQAQQTPSAAPSLTPHKTGIPSATSNFFFSRPVASPMPGSSMAPATSSALAGLSTPPSLAAGAGASSLNPLTAQPTGFAGSSVRPFKPTSDFGASLVTDQSLSSGSAPAASAAGPQPPSMTLAPQKTGMASIASEFVFSRPGTSATTLRTSPNPSTSSAIAGLSSLSISTASPAPFSAITTTSTPFSAPTSAPSLVAGTASPLTTQPTGFAGSGIRPFQPTSSFGASLVASHGLGSPPVTSSAPASSSAPTGAMNANGGSSAFGTSVLF